MTSYNGLAMESERLSWHDVTDLSYSLWSRGVLWADHGLILKSIKLDSVSAHHNILRAEEELIKTEMAAIVSKIGKFSSKASSSCTMLIDHATLQGVFLYCSWPT